MCMLMFWCVYIFAFVCVCVRSCTYWRFVRCNPACVCVCVCECVCVLVCLCCYVFTCVRVCVCKYNTYWQRLVRCRPACVFVNASVRICVCERKFMCLSICAFVCGACVRMCARKQVTITLQHTAPGPIVDITQHLSATIRHTAARCNTLQYAAKTATHSNTQHRTATHSNAQQHTTTQCSTLHLVHSLTLLNICVRTSVCPASFGGTCTQGSFNGIYGSFDGM